MTSSEPANSENQRSTTCRVADLLLDIGEMLLVSGAHCGRITRNIDRVAEVWGYRADLFLTFTGLMISVRDLSEQDEPVARFRRCPLHGVHFGVVTEISLLTWQVSEEKLSVEKVSERLAEIRKLPHNSRLAILFGIGSACACLCALAGGTWKNAAIAFVAAFCGMFLRQEILKRRFNPMIAFILASFTTTLIAGTDVMFHLGGSPEKTLATSVLYLIPGVPLINCAIDLIEGHIPTGIARGVFAGFILFCIAVGMSTAILLLGLAKF